ncbi:nucleoside-diphosphate sugar epimerase [Methylacidiphilum sp. Yel]|jgi:nucleoside-diphosphate-sugar epimerase|uniref:NAD-dependent epimerase/dehydratase family protein n=1 Tax=Methylacidiphilum sp. Yel TaxID=1847730 RepID=UPI00106D5C28|nr:NAD-dependent epimerase/dehydratase family protein [Methylacidiphilum sp. Yel]TFE67729.1 nucleoside-diphosphate sugar epimerase [Methylacidiphilum sp. Yel]
MDHPVLIIGCGYIGTLVARSLQQKNQEVIGLVKSQESKNRLQQLGIPAVALDITNHDSLNSLSKISAVIFSASSNRAEPLAFEKIFSIGLDNALSIAKNCPFLLVSSTSVYTHTEGQWVDEESPATPATSSGKILKKAEEKVLDRGGTVLRASGIYGPQRVYRITGLLQNTVRIDPRKKWINQIHGQDLATAIVHFLTIPGLFNITDDLPTLEEDFFHWLCQRFELPLPPIEPKAPHPKRGYSNKRVSNKKAKTFGFMLDFPTFQEGYSELIKFFKTH